MPQVPTTPGDALGLNRAVLVEWSMYMHCLRKLAHMRHIRVLPHVESYAMISGGSLLPALILLHSVFTCHSGWAALGRFILNLPSWLASDLAAMRLDEPCDCRTRTTDL